MGKKLLFLYILLLFSMISPSGIYAQCSEPTSISITNNSGSSICEDETISFSSSVNPTNPSVAYTYQWQVQLNGGTWTDISGATNASLSNYDAAVGNNKFRLRVGFCEGTASSGTKDSPISSTIVVYENKTGTVSISANKTNICPGEQINFTSSPTNHGGSGATYEWRLLNDNSVLSNSASFSSTEIPDGGEVQLFMTSSVPCVDPFQSTILTITHKDGIPSQPATISLETETDLIICPNTSATFSVTNDPTATSYIWNLPSGWTGTSSTNSINITTGSASASVQTISVKAVNECGESTIQTLDVTVGPGKPATPSEIQLSDEDNDGIICPGELITLSVTNDPEVNEYIWTLPSGWSGSSTTNSIDISDIEFGEDGTVSVISTNDCLSSEPRTLNLNVNTPVPGEPDEITGTDLVCPGVNADYGISSVDYADSYVWILDDNIIEGISGTSYTFNSMVIGDHKLEVRAVNECGEGPIVSKIIEVDDGAPDPVEIINSLGENAFCEGATGLEFSVTEDARVGTYSWIVPAGWTITTNSGSSITVTAGSFGQDGTISVTATSDEGCGEVSDNFAVSIKDPVPIQPGVISGPSEVCMGSTNTFTVAAVNYATSYEWTLSDGSIETTTGPSVDFPINSAGDITLNVKAINECGDSPASENFNIESFNGAPVKPGPITSSLASPNVCPPINNVTFSVPEVPNTLDYTWNVPSGWDIINGEGTNSISVNINASVSLDSGNITVQANNACGGSTASDAYTINLGEYVVADLGPDKTVCEVSTPLSFTANVSFNGKSLKINNLYTPDGTGTLPAPPNGKVNNFSFTYTPVAADFAKEYISIRIRTEEPNGDCESPETEDYNDEVRIYFLDNPTASFTGTDTEICYNTGASLDISGTPNTTLTYSNGTATSTLNLDASGSATINTGNLTETTTYTLQSIAYTNGPGCQQTLSASSSVTVNPVPSAVLSYDDAPFCNSNNGTYMPTLSETVGIIEGGTYSASGITVNATDGSFSPAGVAAGTYTITYNFDDPLGCGYEPITTDITIYESVEITTQPVESRVCEGDAINLSVAATGDGLSYQWYKGSGTGSEISGATSANFNIPGATIDDEAIYYVIVRGTAPCTELKSDEIQVLVDEEIEITELATDAPDNEICEGGSVIFSVTAAAGDEVLTYQWYDNNGEPISGATASTYKLTGASLENSGDYYVEIGGSTDYTCTTVTSENISLIINETPNADISYTGPYCSSDSGLKSVSFSGTAGNYTGGSFSFSVESGGSNLAIDSTTGDINPSASDPGVYFISYTIPASGGCSEVIETTQVTITEAPTATIAFTDDVTEFCNDDTQGTLTPNLAGSGNYTGGSFAGVPGIVSGTGEINFEGLAAGNYTITYTIPPSEGCSDNVATLDITVYESVKITSEPFPVAVCSANNTQLEVAATGANLSYQWFKDGNLISGATSAIYQINSASVTEDDGNYYVEVSGENACKTVTSETVTVTVDENIIIDTQPQPQDICIGGEINLSVAATASGGDPIYQWRKDGVDISGANSATLSISNAQLSDSGEYDVVIDGPDGYACDLGYSEKILVTVNEAATVEAGEPINACSTDGTVAIGSDASATNYSSLVWTSSGTGTFEDANALITNYIPGTGETGEVTLTLTVQGNAGCSEVSDAVTVNISNFPVINSFAYSTTEFCVSIDTPQPPSLDLSNATVGDGIFSYTGETGNTLDLNTETGDINPSSSTPGTYMVTFEIPSDGICEAVSESVEVVIGDLPVADFTYLQNAVCRDTRETNPTLPIDETALPHTDADTFSSTPGLVFVDAATGEIDITSSTPGNYTITRTVDYTGDGEDGCEPVTATFDIQIFDKPIPDFSYATGGEFCSDESDPSPLMAEGAVTGTFTFTSAESANLIIDATTGVIDLDGSDPGTYTIRNTVDLETDACEEVFFDFEITIFEKKDPTFSYTSTAYCISDGIALVDDTTLATGGSFQAASLGDHLNPNTGEINWELTDTDLIGNHTISYTIPANGVCAEVSATFQITIDALPEGGKAFWTKNNERIFLTCVNPVSGYASDLQLNEYTGQISHWEYRGSSATNWTKIEITEPILPAEQVEAAVSPGDETTVFRAVLINNSCNGGVYSQTAMVSVIPADIKPTPVEVDKEVICIGDEITLSSQTGYSSTGEKFEGGQFTESGIKNKGWDFTQPDGTVNDYDAAANNGRADHWLKMNASGGEDGKVYTGTLPTGDTGTTIRWTSELGVNEKFALVTGDNDSYMETPVFSLNGMDEAVFTWDQGYNLTEGATITVEISTDGGNSYNTVLYTHTGDGTVEGGSSGNYTDFGGGTPATRPKNKMVIDLGAYLGQQNLRVRFNYNGAKDGDVWAVDNIKVPEGPQDVILQWYYDEDLSDPDNELETIGVENQGTVTFTPRKIGWNDFEVQTRLILDSNGDQCQSIDNFKTIRVWAFDRYETNVEAIVGACGANSVTLNATVFAEYQDTDITTYPTADGYVGSWQVETTDGTIVNDGFTLSNQDPDDTETDPLENPNAIFTAEDLGNYVFKWILTPTDVDETGELIDNSGCPPLENPVDVTLIDCTTLDFDGDDDYIDLGNNYNGNFFIEAWIRPFDRPIDGGGTTEANTGVIFSSAGFEITMEQLSSKIDKNGRWYHIAVSSGGNLWIDGVASGSISTNGSGINNTSIGARYNANTKTTSNHFSGWIDELRIWKNAPNEQEIRFMMNQRIKLVEGAGDATPIEGEIVPNRTVAGSYLTNGGNNMYFTGYSGNSEDLIPFYDQTWGDLEGYYRLISDNPDPDNLTECATFLDNLKPVNGYTPDHSIDKVPGRLVNITTDQQNTSPTPYCSGDDGDWAVVNTWARPDVWDYPNSTSGGEAIEWNIARINHNIDSGDKDITMLGVLSETVDKLLNIESDHFIRISHYLLLDGNMDLVSESQLLQDHGSILAEQSKGWLQRDQQGRMSSYNYNYWSSPVSDQSTTPNNAPYSIGQVLLDGTDPNTPKNINFQSAYHAADHGGPTNPITLSTYWMWKFARGRADDYSDWRHVDNTGTMQTGEGYTMKGTSGPAGLDDEQNYIFEGKPHNGIIQFTIGEDENYLLGNPYPSALDSQEFIRDNLKDVAGGRNSENVFNGSLYFWDHFGGQTHILEEYEGSYSVLNLSGGLPGATLDPRVNDEADMIGARAPERFIPVGQGFFLLTNEEQVGEGPVTDGGTLIFKNSQRSWAREADGSSLFLKPEYPTKEQKTARKDERTKIRLRFKSPKGYRRQILVTRDENTTSDFDIGYDAPLVDNNLEDMYWLIEDKKYVIQAVPDFDKKRVLPVGIKLDQDGEFTFKIDSVQNWPDGKELYLKDKEKDSVHDILAGPYVSTAEKGTIHDRFELVFEKVVDEIEPEVPIDPIVDKPGEDPDDLPEIEGLVGISYSTFRHEVKIANYDLLDIQKVIIYNLNGQLIQEFEGLPTQKEINLGMRPVRTGVYIVKAICENGVCNKKIIVR
ncbi:T9SS type A sorting domain-containing protein [Gramella sp. GC03-9]|uniref:T9SS type A sorting domain-containing protein n=1 Tax=Christiangramia oceanisediminis TaxID=2920386 RepID=A0A9X2KV95_9FLAO|nr:LamG-like jellyroll fold domain-containing protein [Gramella oceanisediminis]MCP9198450.1 T9SS type A sorting domain-containing protein [Gramella oceanisediminis]